MHQLGAVRHGANDRRANTCIAQAHDMLHGISAFLCAAARLGRVLRLHSIRASRSIGLWPLASSDVWDVAKLTSDTLPDPLRQTLLGHRAQAAIHLNRLQKDGVAQLSPIYALMRFESHTTWRSRHDHYRIQEYVSGFPMSAAGVIHEGIHDFFGRVCWGRATFTLGVRKRKLVQNEV